MDMLELGHNFLDLKCYETLPVQDEEVNPMRKKFIMDKAPDLNQSRSLNRNFEQQPLDLTKATERGAEKWIRNVMDIETRLLQDNLRAKGTSKTRQARTSRGT